jgi:hypothetical protein
MTTETNTATGVNKVECAACNQAIWVNTLSLDDMSDTLTAEGWSGDVVSEWDGKFLHPRRFFAACPAHKPEPKRCGCQNADCHGTSGLPSQPANADITTPCGWQATTYMRRIEYPDNLPAYVCDTCAVTLAASGHFIRIAETQFREQARTQNDAFLQRIGA